MKIKVVLFSASLLASFLLLQSCISPEVSKRLNTIEARQDSLVALVTALKEKTDFIAVRAGWRPPPDTTPKEIPLAGSYSEGPENAVLTIVEFSDLECPYCSGIATVLDSVSKAYPQDVRLVFKHFPLSFHPQAKPAAAAALAAGKQGKFFDYRFRLAKDFRNLGDSTYLAVAKELGLDMAQFKKDMSDTSAANQRINQDLILGAKLEVEGTPTVFVNGKLAESRSYEYFVQKIEAAKKKG